MSKCEPSKLLLTKLIIRPLFMSQYLTNHISFILVNIIDMKHTCDLVHHTNTFLPLEHASRTQKKMKE